MSTTLLIEAKQRIAALPPGGREELSRMTGLSLRRVRMLAKGQALTGLQAAPIRNLKADSGVAMLARAVLALRQLTPDFTPPSALHTPAFGAAHRINPQVDA